MSIALPKRKVSLEQDLETRYRLPAHITLRCLNDEIHLYRKTNAGFYRNQIYDLELVGIFKSENELRKYSESC